MTVAEIMMIDKKLDDQFQRIRTIVNEENMSSEVEGRELDWWLEEYPTLESAETELLKRHKQFESLDRLKFKSSVDYLSESAKIDREIMMLEMTIDELYKDWTPSGAKHEDFQIGTIFRAGGGRFLCTDVGTRTICAIRYTPRSPDKMNGPPYFLIEQVWDEFDIEGVTILKK